MKTLTFTILKITLFILLLSIPQSALASSKQIETLLQQRIELLEETLRLARLRFQAGVGSLEDFGWLIPEMLEVRLKIIDMSETSNSGEERIKVLETALNEAQQTEEDVKLLQRAGLGTERDSLIVEIWRLNIETQLEREKESLKRI